MEDGTPVVCDKQQQELNDWMELPEEVRDGLSALPATKGDIMDIKELLVSLHLALYRTGLTITKKLSE